MLQQPGVTVSGVANGNGRSGLSLFNTRNPGIKKNWIHRGRQTQNRFKCTNVYTCGHVDLHLIQLIAHTFKKKKKIDRLRTGLKSHPNWLVCQIIYSYLSYMRTVDPVMVTTTLHKHRCILGALLTVIALCCYAGLLSTHTHWRAKVHLQSVVCLRLGSGLSRAV